MDTFTMPTADYWINKLNMKPHPEGGHYQETYRSEGSMLVGIGQERRNYATAIYFLLQSGEFSALHRLASDEIWHFHTGSPVTIHTITPIGEHQQIELSPDAENPNFQAVIPAGYWFGAELTRPHSYCLVSCTVFPGFDFADFELANRDALIRKYPQHEEIITRLTHEA